MDVTGVAAVAPAPEGPAGPGGVCFSRFLGGKDVGPRRGGGGPGQAAPVVADGLVVAGLPDGGPGHTAVHVVAEQVLLVLRRVPLHHH